MKSPRYGARKAMKKDAKISVPGKLDKTTMANRLLVWSMEKRVRNIDPYFDFDSFVDPNDTWNEAAERLGDRYGIFIKRYDDRPEGPNGEICNGSTFCKYCTKEIPYSRSTRKFCDNNSKCRKRYWRSLKKAKHSQGT